VRNRFAPAAAVVALIAIAGCGSSNNKSTTTNAATQPASTSSQTPAATSTGASASATPGSVITVSTKQAKSPLGTILAAGPKRLTVYLFEGDKAKASSCTGACSKVWPPVTTTAAAIVGGSAKPADMGTITRADGVKQVTYNGHPLYYFARDGDSGDAYGQGIKSFGADWYVLSPSGNKVDTS
jgi:predicted lipoprotein with Yx(FWY)xxD motif